MTSHLIRIEITINVPSRLPLELLPLIHRVLQLKLDIILVLERVEERTASVECALKY